ncbi:LacI family DNA-binding transcriptional regulator [Cohnella sp. GCM10020058]|uniref:LacI family DNA-binding transcriptional regulator n=1 Tax=Cohnella sp. GCM10020058 TaxID=3317330 RepID=UPI00362F4305
MPEGTSRKVTIQDIADAAQVAKSTVSKVINDSPKVSDQTKSRIWGIIREMNYTPSSLATQLAKQTSGNIGLLIDLSREHEFLDHFFFNIIGGIESSLIERKYELTISNIQQPDRPEQHFMKRLVLNRRVDGLIANNSVLTEPLCEELLAHRFPFISIGEVQSPVSWVDFDNEAGGHMLAAHLLERGYRRLAFFAGERDEKLFVRRFGGFARALAEAGLPAPDEADFRGLADTDSGYALGLRMLDLPAEERPDAVVCMSNYAAFGLLKAARERGVDVPGDLGIAAFDDYPMSPFTTPPLTCLKIDTFQLGVSAGELLLEQLRDPDMPLQKRLLEPQLIVRESTRSVTAADGQAV